MNDIDDMPEINTGNGYQNNLIATTNDRLKKTVVELRGLDSRIRNEAARVESSIKIFQQIVKDSDDKNTKLQKTIVFLTWVMVGFGIIQIIITFCK